MVGRLQDKIALVVGAGSVGPVWATEKLQQSCLPAKARRYYAPISTRTPRRKRSKSYIRRTVRPTQFAPT